MPHVRLTASRPCALDDPTCLHIYESIDYDYERTFGTPDGSRADRSVRFDDRWRSTQTA